MHSRPVLLNVINAPIKWYPSRWWSLDSQKPISETSVLKDTSLAWELINDTYLQHKEEFSFDAFIL